MKTVRLYPHPDNAARGGIPIDGELFTEEDARRLVGNGTAVRRRPTPASPVKRSRKPAAPAREG